MKFLMITSIVLFSLFANARTYYFSTSTGNDNRTSTEAQNPSTPWKTINQLNAFFPNLQPGDSILFKRSETFNGQISVSKSGNAALPIIVSDYGTGANPVISGLSQLTNWTQYNSNIYYTALDVPTLNMVTVGGAVKGMGRYPNTGYLNYESHTDNTSITDNQLSSAINWTGAEVVIRKYRWILDRQTITAQSGGTLSYNALNNYGNNSNYYPLDGDGYFIQNDLKTLDQDGEWYYDATAKRLYIYSTSSPSLKVIKATTLDRNLTVNSQNYITFNNLDFIGGNTDGAYLIGANYITFNNCNFIQQGGNGLYGLYVSNITLNGGTITDAFNSGIYVEYQGSYITVNKVALSNLGTIAGTGKSGDAAQEGISISGDNTIITNCSVKKTGYNGINFSGNDAHVENNYIDSFCTIKDDGGGIYTYMGERGIIKNNIVLNAIGAYAGAEWSYWEPYGKAAGIYLDNGVSNHNATVSGNTVAHGEWGGIFNNNNGGNNISNNTVFDFDQQMFLIEYSIGSVRNVTVKNNQFIARTSVQKNLYNQMYVDESPSLLGNFDNNYYASSTVDSLSIQTSTNGNTLVRRTLANWKAYSSNDEHSNKSAKAITDSTSLRFEYNATSINKNINLKGNYFDVTGKSYQGLITLAPYSSVVLIKDSIANTNNQSNLANAGPDQTITFPLNTTILLGSGNDLTGTITSSLWTQMSGSAVTIVSPNLLSTLVAGLSQGIYKFKLMIMFNNGITSIDSVQITVNQIVLPLTLLKFNTQLTNSGTDLLWKTASEENVLGFDIEKMTANKWTKIGFMPSSKSGLIGNSYSFIDYERNMGSNFYRLKIVDTNGKFTYSNIINKVDTKNNKTIVYQNTPNPFSANTTIRYILAEKAAVKIIIYNELGVQVATLVNEIKQPGEYNTRWQTTNFASGNYFYSVIIGNDITTKGMLKIN